MTDESPKPLTEEEEAELRREVASDPHEFVDCVGLLATIDDLRAALAAADKVVESASALLAMMNPMRAELVVARKVIEAARAIRKIGSFSNTCNADLSPALSEALDAYDEVTRG